MTAVEMTTTTAVATTIAVTTTGAMTTGAMTAAVARAQATAVGEITDVRRRGTVAMTTAGGPGTGTVGIDPTTVGIDPTREAAGRTEATRAIAIGVAIGAALPPPTTTELPAELRGRGGRRRVALWGCL